MSCVSARHVVAAADPDRYNVRVVGITTEGRWVDTSMALRNGLPTRALPSPDTLASPNGGQATAIEPVEAVTEQGAGPLVVLPLLHGPMGEDGSVQGLLEVAGVPYCGPGVAGSAAAMDKGLAKALLGASGLPQARYLFFRETEIDAGVAAQVGAELGWPVFLKPANMGSSIGISRVTDASGLDAAIQVVRRFDEYIIIEEAVRGRELEIGVLGWPDLRASVAGEIRPSHEFYDYEDKYIDDAAILEVPARLPAGIAERDGSHSRVRLPGAPGRLHGPGRLLLRGGWSGPPDQRGEHHSRLHAYLHVPAPLGGVGRSLPGARGRTGQPGLAAVGPPLRLRDPTAVT